MGKFVHACEGEMVCESINPKIPYFNAPIYLENKVRTTAFFSLRMIVVLSAVTDRDWQSRRDSGPAQSSIFYDQTSGRDSGYVFQSRR